MRKQIIFIIVVLISVNHTDLYCQDLGLDSLETLVRSNLWSQPDLAADYAQQFNKLAQQGTDLKVQAKGLNFVGLTHYVKGNYITSIDYYLNAYEIIKNTDDQRYAAILLNNIGSAHRVREKPIETEGYYKKALAIFEEINDTLWVANVTNNLGILLNTQLKFKESEQYFLKAQERFDQLQDSASLAILWVNLSSLYFDDNRISESKENIDLYLNTNPEKDDLYIYSKNILARIFMKEGNLKKAESLVSETLKISSEKGLSLPNLNARKYKYDLLKLQGKYQQALTAYESYIAQKDSVFNREKDAQLTEMLEKYEAKEKETEIQKLSFEDDLNQSRIRQQRYGLLGASGALGLLGFFSYRLRIKNQRIEKQDAEKEVLLKEIHHRVKNNLQVISSLLGLQGLSVKDAKAKAAIQEGRSRVHSMSLIHQSLYKKDNLTGIEMRPYLEKLINDLIATYNYLDIDIQSVIDCEDITLDVETVVPIGLIINELVTNSVKYAFEGRTKGVITASLSEKNDQLYLSVADDGIGLDTDQLKAKEDSYGHSLIRAFKDKLDAEIKVSGYNGTEVELLIKTYKSSS